MQSRIKEFVEKNKHLHGRILTMENDPPRSFTIQSKKQLNILAFLVGIIALGLLVGGIYILWTSIY